MRLLDPVNLGSRRTRNRLLFGPHETNLGRDRGLSDRHVAYYARRAAGGCGIVVSETASVHDSDWPYERAPLAADCEPGWRAVSAAVHEHGGLLLASLGHSGLQGSSAYSQTALWAPSRFPDPVTREVPMVMEQAEIDLLVDAFARSAAAAVAAGCDGVELAAAQRSLLRQFLSGLTNTRDDAYGADRTLLVRGVLAAVRSAVGTAVVGLRLSCDEQAPWAGITPEASGELAAALADPVDYVVAVRAGPYDAAGSRPDGHIPPGFAIPLAHRLRAALPPRVAVVAQGSIVDAGVANQALEGADLVEMTRAQIADPDLAVTLGAGRTPRPCVLCNQACLVRDARNPLVSCIGEPGAGHETDEPDPAGSDPVARTVLVIGAGPAGLEAARVAAGRGHSVTVVDPAPTGGAVPDAAAGAGRERLVLLVEWLAAQCERLDVRRETTAADAATVAAALAAGARVVLATGGQPAEPPWSGRCQLPVRTAREVLRGAALPAGPVVIDDPVGGPVGVSVAERLAADGRTVALVTQDPVAGVQLSRSGDLAPANARLGLAGVRLLRRSRLIAAGDGGAVVEDLFTGARETVPAVAVVDAGYGVPYLPAELDQPGVVVAGDAVAPRTILEAVLEGRRAGLAVGKP